MFHVGSVAKQFTAFATALLIEDRKLARSDPLRKYFPELPAWADAITIDQLIYHTSGVRDHLTLWEMSGRTFAEEVVADEAIDLLARQRALDFPPGTQWSYSNSGYFLLGETVGRVTGTSLARFAQDAIFGPLDMTSTHFRDDNTRIVPRRATGYVPDQSSGFRTAATTLALVGSGGLLTTVLDLVKWDENFYDNRLGGGAALTDTITTPGRLANGEPHPYAFGLFPGTYRGLRMIEHSGSFPGFSAQLLRFPTEHASIAVLCNHWTADPVSLAQRVADSYLADRLEAPSAPPSPPAELPAPKVEIAPAALRRFVGRYALQQPGQFALVVERADGLGLVLSGQELPLRPTSATTFAFLPGGGEIEFAMDEHGTSLSFRGAPFPPAPRLVAPQLSAAALAEYAGRYTSTELDTWFDIRAGETELEVRRRYRPWGKLEAIAPDRFVGGPADFKFERDGTSRPTGFIMTVERASNILFSRETPANGAGQP